MSGTFREMQTILCRRPRMVCFPGEGAQPPESVGEALKHLVVLDGPSAQARKVVDVLGTIEGDRPTFEARLDAFTCHEAAAVVESHRTRYGVTGGRQRGAFITRGVR